MSAKFPPRQQTSPTKEIVAEINRLGLKEAANQYQVSTRTLDRWLKSQNYKPKRIYVKQEGKAS